MNINALHSLTGKIAHYPATDEQYETQAIRQFASDNLYQYQTSNKGLVEYKWTDYKLTPAWLGMVGIALSKNAYHIVSGTIMGYPFDMFLMWDNATDGVMYENPTEEEKLKYAKQQTTGVIRIKLPKTFPQVVLDSTKNDGMRSSVGASYESSQRLSLEGDFDQYFDLYAPLGLQVNVLTLLAPNMMQILKNHSGLFDVEFYGNEMIIFTKTQLYDPAVMTALNEALSEQLAYVNRLMPSWNYQPTKPPFDILTKPLISGKVMRIGGLRLSAKAQIIAILLGIMLYGFIISLFN